jgi:hypothetical protein
VTDIISANNLELPVSLAVEKKEKHTSWDWITNVASEFMDMHVRTRTETYIGKVSS